MLSQTLAAPGRAIARCTCQAYARILRSLASNSIDRSSGRGASPRPPPTRPSPPPARWTRQRRESPQVSKASSCLATETVGSAQRKGKPSRPPPRDKMGTVGDDPPPALAYFSRPLGDRAADLLPVAREAIAQGCCPRCALRLVGVSDAAAYRAPPPTAVSALDALPAPPLPATEATPAIDKTPATDTAPAPDAMPAMDKSRATDTGPAIDKSPAPDTAAAPDTAPANDTTPAPATAPSPPHTPGGVCVVCLGVLQLVEEGTAEGLRYNGKGKDVIGEDVAESPGMEKRRWRLAAGGAPSDIAAALAASGHEVEDFSLDLNVPAQVALRQAGVLSHLRSTFSRYRVAMAGITDVRDAWRAAMEAPLQERVGKPIVASSSLRLSVYCAHRGTAREARHLPIKPTVGRKRRRDGTFRELSQPEELSLPLSNKALSHAATMGEGALRDAKMGMPLYRPDTPVQVLTCPWRDPVLIGGYYLKTRRGVSNSPFFVDGERQGTTSVQEAIGDLVQAAMKAEGHKMISAGREDVDVRMLGKGRPFVLELPNPHVARPDRVDLAAIEAALRADPDTYGGVEARGLRLVGPGELRMLKEGEEDKQKRYLATVRLSRAVTDADLALLSGLRDLTLHQRTPVRVSHRRADLVRDKTVHEMAAERVPGSDDAIALALLTSAGTYVKEFVHGDGGRTEPSVGTLLGCQADIETLDVLEIVMEWL